MDTAEKDIDQDQQYFAYYGQLANQQNMLQDLIRTTAYHQAIHSLDAKGKVVMDLGAGSGILSMFAAHAGARQVYAIEASSAIHYLRLLVKHNGFTDIIKDIHTKVENLANDAVTSTIDALISEPIGVFLFHERMFESFLDARDRFKPAVVMPVRAELMLAPFSDAALYQEVRSRVTEFWEGPKFFDLDMSVLLPEALREAFSAPLVGSIDPNSLLSHTPTTKMFDFMSLEKEELHKIEMELDMESEFTGIVHGFGSWFITWLTEDCIIDTSPGKPRTHWHQLKLLLPTPFAVNQGDRIQGIFTATVNNQRSYDLVLVLKKPQTVTFRWKLHDQQFWNIYPHETPSYPPTFYNLYQQSNEENPKFIV